MLRPSESFLQEALTNNTFDLKCTERALQNGLTHSYDYLYRLQRNMIDFEESYYTTRNTIDRPDFGDFYLDDDEYVCLNLPGEIVTQSFRESYRQSDLFDTEIDYDTLNMHHDVMFTRFPVLFIDDKVVRHPKFEIKDDYFHVRTEERRDFLLKKTFDTNRWEYEYYDHTACLQLIGHSYYQEIVTNSSMLKLQSSDYNLVTASYLEQFNFHKDESQGTYFVTAFIGDETLGTEFTDCDIDSDGNIHMYFGAADLHRIKRSSEDITLRFYFYQYCHSYKSYHTNAITNLPTDWYVRALNRGDVVESELIEIKDGDKPHQMPIPVENLMLFKVYKDDLDELGYVNRHHMPATEMFHHYPNIYQQKTGLEEGDRFRLYYFYVDGYELSYNNRYEFFKEFIRQKFGSYEEPINRLYFGTKLDSPDYIAASTAITLLYAQSIGIPEETNPIALFGEMYAMLREKVPISKVISYAIATPLAESPSLEVEEIYDTWMSFGSIFYKFVFADYADYRYDEFDYTKCSDIHPIEYKIEKLKKFISDDPEIFLNYVKDQDVLPIKYAYVLNANTIADRTREMDVAGNYFGEDMVEFAITSPYVDDEVTGRVFIDGLYAASSVFYHYADSEYIYVPLRYVPENARVEIEIFPKYERKIPLHFDAINDSQTITFEKTDILYPTLHDFLVTNKETGDIITHDNIVFSVIDDTINYVDTEKEGTTIFYEKWQTGELNRTHFYLQNGSYYDSDGFGHPEKDKEKDWMIENIANGNLIQTTGDICNNQYLISEDADFIGYSDVLDGVSIINRENKGVNFSRTDKLLLQPRNISLYNTDLELTVKKSPAYMSSVVQVSTYPVYSYSRSNLVNELDYIRVFKNGKLMSKNKYTLLPGGNTGPQIQLLDRFDKGDSIVFDISPYYNRLIYYKKKIDSSLIDLSGYIDKPFDARFYEVYLNGRRLTEYNLKPISPYEVQLNHITSSYNLAIFERDRDWEYYFIGFDGYYTLSNFIKESFIDDDMRRYLIEWTIGEPIDVKDVEEEMDWNQGTALYSIFFDIFYHMRLLPLGLASADENQWKKNDIQDNYSTIYDAYHTRDPKGNNVLMLNPDVFCSEKPEDSEDCDWQVYMMGNDDDLSLIEG